MFPREDNQITISSARCPVSPACSAEALGGVSSVEEEEEEGVGRLERIHVELSWRKKEGELRRGEGFGEGGREGEDS